MAVPPLTKQTPDGVLYVRPAIVEANIQGAQTLDLACLKARLTVADSKSASYLRSETLVHLIRRAIRRNDELTLSTLMTVLLKRCEKNLMGAIPDGKLPTAADLREDVIGQFAEIIAGDGKGDRPDELDIYECRFNMAFAALRIDIARSEITRINRLAQFPEPPDEPDAVPDEDLYSKVSKTWRSTATPEKDVFRKQLWKAIDALPADERMRILRR